MPTRQTRYFTGMPRRVEPRLDTAHVPVVDIVRHVINVDVTTADVLELCRVPPGAKITNFTVVTENFPATNLNFGFMTGTPGDAVSARTVGSELIPATAAPGPMSATLLTLAALAPRPADGGDVSIGMGVSASVTAAGNRIVNVLLEYTYLPA